MNDIKILLADSEIDIKGTFGFGINYTVSDVKDPSKRNAPYSKTVTLLGTKNNNRIMGGLWDVNADFTFFNPNFKTECSIIVNSSTVIEGFLRLKNIKIVNTNFEEGDAIEYECVITSKSVDFYGKIQDKLLTELDFSYYNHDYTKANIVSSWSNDSRGAYVYPLMWNGKEVGEGSEYYKTDSFKPAIFEKAYLVRMAKDAGYSLTGSLMDETTTEGLAFSKAIIPFNGELPEITEAEVLRRKFKASSGSSLSLASGSITSSFWTGVNSGIVNVTNATNDSTAGNFDNGGNYDATLNKWTVDADGVYGIHATLDFISTFSTGGTVYMSGYREDWWGNTVQDTPAGTTIRFSAQVYIDGAAYGNHYSSNYVQMPTTLTTSDVQNRQLVISLPTVHLQATQEVTIVVSVGGVNFVAANGRSLNYTTDGTINGTVNTVSYTMELDSTVIHNEVRSSALTDGDDIILSEFIPKNIKQSDILTDIIKRYNAYITLDPDKSNTLVIEPRDTFYARGDTLDWTNKKDHSKPDKIKLLSELQNKKIKFSYTPDEKDYNENYTKALSGDIYGEHEIEFVNEFVKGEKMIQTPFSPTPLIYNQKDPLRRCAIIPSIKTSAPETNPRILHYGGLKSTLNGQPFWIESTDGAGTTSNVAYYSYPYAGHYDDPINPTMDIHFGTVPFEYYSAKATTTSSTQYNNYWKNYIEQIAEGKQVDMYFFLNEVDINYIKDNLNAKIFVKDAYYYINKIVDYNPIVKGVTKVELLKIKDGNTFVDNIEIIDGDTYNPNEGTDVTAGSGNGNTSGSTGVTINGEDNRVGTASYNVTINGNDNFVGDDSPNAIITGDNNVIDSAVENGFVIGASNRTVSQSNTGYIGEQFYRDGKPATVVEDYELADVITLRDAGTLEVGVSYNCIDLGLQFKAEAVDVLNFNSTRILEVPKASLYSSLEIWIPNKDYSVDDLVIWGGVVWRCTAISGGYSPIDDYTLNSSYYEVNRSAGNYETLKVDVLYSEADSQIVTTRDSRGNVVNTMDEDLHVLSDWNDSRISNNIFEGFINNDVTDLSNNICKIIKNNRNFGSITGNRNNGDIMENTSQTATTFSITDNVNNGSIDFNHSTANITINNNVNNGYIGNATTTNRAASISDTTVNK